MKKWIDLAATEEMESDPKIIEMAVGTVARYIGRQEKTLSIGCGDGTELEILLRESDQVSGIDLSMASLQKAGDKGYDVKKCDMHQIDYPDDSFDLVFMKDVFEHAVSHIQAFSEACRVSKRYVAIILPDESWQMSGWHFMIPTLKQMISLGMKCGMNLRAFEEYDVNLYQRGIKQEIYIFEKQ